MQKILLIGDGRLAKHLQYWNSLIDEPNSLILWNRKENTLSELKFKIADADLIWLAISDSAILDFFEKNLTQAQKKCVHFSGAFNDSRIFSAHPMMSFPNSLLPKTIYSKIHIALTEANNLQQALPGFTNSFTLLDPKKKAFYHSLCVVTGNFPQLLWSETLIEFQKLNIPVSAFETYLEQITENFLKFKQAALTGPLIRKDFSTIEKNILSLEQSKLKIIYQKFVEVFTK